MKERDEASASWCLQRSASPGVRVGGAPGWLVLKVDTALCGAAVHSKPTCGQRGQAGSSTAGEGGGVSNNAAGAWG